MPKKLFPASLASRMSRCNCSGSMAWIHCSCLDHWRKSSANPKSFFECDTCHFKYRFGGTVVGDQLLMARLLGSRCAIHVLAVSLLGALVFAGGFVAKAIDPRLTWRECFDCFNLQHLISGATATGIGSLLGWLVTAAGVGGFWRIGAPAIGGGDRRGEAVVVGIAVAVGLCIALSWIYTALEGFAKRATRRAQHVVLDAPGRVPHID